MILQIKQPYILSMTVKEKEYLELPDNTKSAQLEDLVKILTRLSPIAVV